MAEKILVQQAAGVGPDIMNLLSSTMLGLIEDGIVDDMAPAALNDLTKNFIPPVVETMKINGRNYGFPTEAIVHLPVINADLYDLNGIAYPKTWSDLMTVQRKLSRPAGDGTVERTGVSLNVSGLPLITHWGSMLNAYQADIIKDGRIVVNSPDVLKATEDYKELAPTPARNFLNGQVGTILRGSYIREDMKAQGATFNIRALPALAGPSGKKASIAYFWMTTVNRASKNKTEAWDFIRWLNSTENKRSLTEKSGYPPITRANLDMYNDEWYRVFATEFDYGKPLPQVRNWQGIQDALTTQITQYLQGKVALVQAMENAISAAQPLLNNVKK
jgi:ABC-type glycerol-3-phosphate transport system substrate-binding protein